MTLATQINEAATVNRSKFFSAMDEPERLDPIPPPNMLDNPPPLPRWSSTNRMTRKLVTSNVTVRKGTTP